VNFTRRIVGCGGCLTCEELVGVSHRRWWGWFWWDKHCSN